MSNFSTIVLTYCCLFWRLKNLQLPTIRIIKSIYLLCFIITNIVWTNNSYGRLMSVNIILSLFLLLISRLSLNYPKEWTSMKQYLPNFKIEYNKENKPGKEPAVFASGAANEEYIARDFILEATKFTGLVPVRSVY